MSVANIEVLVSTMYQRDNGLPNLMNVQGKCLIINQTDFSTYPALNENFGFAKFISLEERGLSRSRNRAIEKSTSEICVIADDDVRYYDGFRDTIDEWYTRIPDADIILFDFYRNNQRSKKIKRTAGKLTLLQAMRGNSVRITFRLESIKRSGVSFNEDFGSGSGKFVASEDIIFMIDCFRKNLKVYYVPNPILYLADSPSTWFNAYDNSYFETIGALSYHFLGGLWRLNAFQFLLRHKRVYESVGFRSAMKMIGDGAKRYKEGVKA